MRTKVRRQEGGWGNRRRVLYEYMKGGERDKKKDYDADRKVRQKKLEKESTVRRQEGGRGNRMESTWREDKETRGKRRSE